jgi:hypothetical protein
MCHGGISLKYYGPKKNQESVEEDPKQNKSTERLDLAQTGARFFCESSQQSNEVHQRSNLQIVLPIAFTNKTKKIHSDHRNQPRNHKPHQNDIETHKIKCPQPEIQGWYHILHIIALRS